VRAAVLGACLAIALAIVALPAASPARAQAAAGGPGLPPEQVEQLLRSERFRSLAAELRCLVCQNQTLADSGAELAIDLRNEVLRQMAAGKDDAQIKSHLVARYGEFVLYRPTFSPRNLALWIGPAALLAIGAIVLWRVGRRRGATSEGTPQADVAERLARVDALLADDGPRQSPSQSRSRT
jgi:cytochrome c-type biogenesis protein CcmH